MKMRIIRELFDIKISKGIDLNNTIIDKYGVNYISRIASNNGIVCKIEKNAAHHPEKSGTITVALVGNPMYAFLQFEEFYTSQNIAVLTEKMSMTKCQKLYYCECIRANAFRFNYGRNGHKGIYNLNLPDIDEIPDYVKDLKIPDYSNMLKPISEKEQKINLTTWEKFIYDELFDIKKGQRVTKSDLISGNTPFISAIDKNNGIRELAGITPIFDGNVITVNYNGSIGEAFYQEKPFWASDDINVLIPKFKLNRYIAMFLITLIRKEKYRYCYGRKWGIERMNKTIIKLPITSTGSPDWEYMENYIKSLPYSSAI